MQPGTSAESTVSDRHHTRRNVNFCEHCTASECIISYAFHALLNTQHRTGCRLTVVAIMLKTEITIKVIIAAEGTVYNSFDRPADFQFL